MSFVVAVPDLVQGAAQDLAGIRASLAEAVAGVAGPTTGVVPAAADEVSAAIAAMFGNVGQEFQALSSQAQAFHTEFVNLINASAGAYLSTEVANAEQALVNAVNAPMQALFGGGPAGAASVPAAGGILGLLGGTTTGGGTGLLSGPVGGLIGSTGLGSLTTGLGLPTLPVVGSLGGVLGSLGTLGSLGSLGGITGSLGGVLGSLGNLGSLGGNLGSLLTSVLPGLPTTLGGLTNSLTGVVNSLLPGLLNIQAGAGPFFTGIAGPYEALFYNTWNNLQSLTSGWLADPFPFLRQFVANQMVYGQTIATALQTGNFAPVSAIPGHIAQNFTNVVNTLTNTAVTSSLDVQELLPNPSLTLDNAVGLPLVFGASLLGPPVATLEAAGYSASAFTSAMQARNASGAIAALIDAPAVIANGFLNGQATFPYALNLSSLTGPVIGKIANVSVVGNFPLDGILHPPGYYPVTATVTTVLGNTLLPPIDVNLGVGSTPFTGLLPFLINYAPQQLAQAIGAPASPPPLISLPLFTF
ncbi:MAG: PE family protein [Mycobacterium sp.]